MLLVSQGQVVFLGPREEVMPFFARMGLAPPPTKTDADFLQEVTSSPAYQVGASREETETATGDVCWYGKLWMRFYQPAVSPSRSDTTAVLPTPSQPQAKYRVPGGLAETCGSVWLSPRRLREVRITHAAAVYTIKGRPLRCQPRALAGTLAPSYATPYVGASP